MSNEMGYKIISKKNGNSIILPASGTYFDIMNSVSGRETGAIYLTVETWHLKDKYHNKEFIKEICFRTWNFSDTTKGGKGMMGLTPWPKRFPVSPVCE